MAELIRSRRKRPTINHVRVAGCERGAFGRVARPLAERARTGSRRRRAPNQGRSLVGSGRVITS
jgi:hypothetical protein